MGSVGNQNPWAPYDNYKDCSQGICSIYCPQFCYLIFPPPPPSYDDSGSHFSPVIIAIIGVLASAFLLVGYYTFVTRYCKRRNDNIDTSAEALESESVHHDQWQTGLDEAQIKTITVFKYQKNDGLIEGTECAVCLSGFQENESLRLLPRCTHAFHLPCIDTWLKSHSNCPLCRSNVAVPGPPPVVNAQNPSAVAVNSYEIRARPNDLVVVVDDQERVVVTVVGDGDATPKSPNLDNMSAEDSENTGPIEQHRTSVSLGTSTCDGRLMISDILKIEETDGEVHVGIGTSKGFAESKSSAK